MQLILLKPRVILGVLLLLFLPVLIGGVAQAQSGTISIGPGSGPTGTSVQIFNSDPQFAGQCFVNGNYIGDVGAGQSLFYTVNDPIGSQVSIGCRYEFEGPLPFQITFIVTSADGDGDGVPDNVDQCPQEFAQTPNGCPQQNPDSDGDGLPDNQDACPNQFFQGGNGCPPSGDGDADGDGLSDSLDACPNLFFQGGNGCPPSTATAPANSTSLPPATQVALPQLPTTGACVVATASTSPVNVRAERSTDAAIVARLDPLQVYIPTQFVDGWYFIESLGGWVRADVVRTGGTNCQNLGGVVPGEPTPTPTSLIGSLPNYIVPLPADLGTAFDGCPDMAAQAGRLPLGQVLRLINDADPCRGLQEVLREVAFGGPRPPVPQPISQALSSTAQCSTDARPFPSPELLGILDALNQINPDLALQVNLAIAAAAGSEAGSDGDRFRCALMAGDVFYAATFTAFLSFGDQNSLFTFFASVCVPAFAPATVSARVANAVVRLSRDESGTGLGVVGTAAFLGALAQPTNPLPDRTRLWCAALHLPGDAVDALTPDQLAAIQWLVDCGVVEPERVPLVVESLNRVEVSDTLLGPAGFTWSQLIAFFRSYAAGTCATLDDFLLFALRAGRQNTELTAVTGLSAEVAVLDVDYSIGGFIYEVICNTAGGSTTVAPPGCEISEFRVPVPTRRGTSANPFGNRSLPDLGGGNSGVPEFNTEVVRRIIPNTNRDPFERGIADVQVQIDSGQCGVLGGEVITTVTTDANGYFFVEGLEDGPYCIIIVPDRSPDALGAGNWWTPISLAGGGTMQLNAFAASEFNILPIAQFGWQREGGEGSGISTFSFIPDFSDFPIDVIPDLLPTAPPGSDSIPDLNPTENILQEFSIVVFEDRCDSTSYGGDPRRLPPGCTNFYVDTLTADGTQDSTEPGIPGVQIELLEGTCETGVSLGVSTSDASGRADASIMLTPGQDYCWSVRANSAVNAPILMRGGWTMVSGPRITYRMTTPADTRNWNISFAWWPQAPDALSEGNPFIIPELLPEVELTLGPPIPTDIPFEPPTGTPVPSYTVDFLALVWADVCNGVGWTGDFRRIPAGCTTVAPTTLDSNGIVDEGETRLAGVQVSIKLGSCDSAESVEPFLTTNGDGQARSNLTLRAGTYCVLVNPTAGPNAAALGAGRWRGGLGREARTEISIPYFRPTVVLNFPWQPLGTTVAGTPPGVFGPLPGPGFAPPLPASGSPICLAGCTPGALPPPRVPTPLQATNPDGSVNPLRQVQDLAAAAGITLSDFQGDVAGLGVFVGRSAPDAPQGLYLYDGGSIFNLGLGDDEAVMGASLSPDGSKLAYISRDANGRGTLYLMGVENGFYVPLFSEFEGTRLEDTPPVWTGDGETLLLVIFDVLPEGDVPNIYALDLADAGAVPELAMANASDPTTTEDEALLAFVRGGNVFIQLAGEAAPRQLTNQPEGTRCQSPFFDAAGINLYFLCRTATEANLVVQGFDGLQVIQTGLPELTGAHPGPVEGIVTLEDGRAVYLAGLDGTNLKPLIDLSDLQVQAMRWAN